ncbi:MAG TPA: two-component regulator propeller domain-containing protein, partial [Edaphobacter sp.]|nr:two-component regulator propeller domain-containing protein [Edaphobacter sp.]
DGVNFRLTSSFSEFSGDPVSGLTTDGEGRLCVIFWGAGVLCHRDEKFVNLAPILRRTTLEAISSWRKEDGALLLTDLIDGILLVRGENVQVLAPPILLPPSLVLALAETRDGKIWLGTASGLFYFADGRTTRAKGVSDKKINCLLPIADRELWVGTSKGLYRWNGILLSRVQLPQALADVQVLALLRDHDGNVWAGTTRGLLRINASGVSVSDEGGFESAGINALFEDREGNLWAGGGRGLERIRDGTFVTYTLGAGSPPSKQDGPVYVDSENRTWFAPAGGGLYVMKDGQVQALKSSFVHDEVAYSITGRKNEIWIGTQRSGLKRFEYRNEVTGGKTYTQANGMAENSVFAVSQSQDGAVWAGTLTSGVSKFKDGKFVTYTTADGLASNTVSAILDTRDGTVWFATPNGLSALSHGHWTTYATEDGLPSNSVNCLFEDSAGVLWIGTSRGLAFFKSGRVQVPRYIPNSLREETFGMSEDKEGWLWIATSDHVLRVSNQKLSSGVLSSAEVFEYGAADGLPNAKGVKRSRSVVADSQGRIWFSTSRGVSVVDPSHIMNNPAPAVPHVEAIMADNDPITVGELVRIPSSRKRITFRYSGASLAVPERIRFRYSLDSFDRGWSEPTAAREAVYTNLSPGSYRFRIIASNSYGQWNDSEAAVSLEVDPAYYQTIWFRSLCVAAFLALLGTLYRLRLRQVAQQFNMRLEERVSERTRIARELHDTLLQSFHGLLPRFQAAHNLLPGRAVDARQVLQTALDDAAKAITEARAAVQDLRSSPTVTNDLAKAIEVLGEELRAHQTSADGNASDFLVQVDGTPQDLHPMFRDEIYRITGEALRNAFHHAHARRIEVEIEYDPRQVRARVRDDGIGIDASMLSQEGRPGHFGLRGMRERSRSIGGQLEVWSERGAGTEVELTIPATVAYGGHVRRRFRVFKRKAGTT